MGDDLAMELGAFQKLRLAVQSNATYPTAAELGSLEERLRGTLGSVGIFDTVEVESTDNPDGLVIGLCQFRSEVSETEVAQTLEGVWESEIRYPFWAAHALLVEPEHVEFQGASRVSATGSYATVHLVAQKSVFPTQREPSDVETRDPSTA